MGRIAGVTAEETRDRVLAAAASVFARNGYDGATTAAICSEAGVSSGALYGHFGSKAELFAATLRSHGPNEVERLLAFGGTTAEVVEAMGERGVALAHRRPAEGSLLVEAIVAAKRHPDVRELLTASFAEGERSFTGLLESGQASGAIDPGIRTAAVSRFITMLVLGSLMVAALDLPEVDDDDWAVLLHDLVGRFGPRPPTT
jgi:AcrR family transcriptional regulator